MLEDLHADNVIIQKADGHHCGPVAASVLKGTIYFPNANVPIEMGDILIRKMPHGADERYVVIDPGFTPSGIIGMPDTFQTEVRREGVLNPPQSSATINYNINGNNARFNLNSTDNSMNVVIESSEGLFEDLRAQLKLNITDKKRLHELETIVNEMQSLQHNSQAMSEKLGHFISKSADLMGIIAPFIPVLTGIATGSS